MKTTAAAILAFALSTSAAFAWGDDGHKVVALIAEHYLTPTAKKQVDAVLAADTDNLTAHDIASEATWADRYRDAGNRKLHYQQTRNWHFVDLEIPTPTWPRRAGAENRIGSPARSHPTVPLMPAWSTRSTSSPPTGRALDRRRGTPRCAEVRAALRRRHAPAAARLRPRRRGRQHAGCLAICPNSAAAR